MDARLTWIDCDEAGDYIVPNVLSPRDLVSRPDNMYETILHIMAYVNGHTYALGSGPIRSYIAYRLESSSCKLEPVSGAYSLCCLIS